MEPGVFYVLMCILFIVLCGLLTTVILLQKKRSAGISSISGMGNSDTYWDKNKSRSREGRLERYTKILALLFFVLAFLFGIF